MHKLNVEIGSRYGRLTVINEIEPHISPNGTKRRMVYCQCDCGNKADVRIDQLISGNTQSCGCLRYEKAKEAACKQKKYNTYDLSGEYGIGYTEKGDEFYFDLEDYDKIKVYCWWINSYGYMIAKHNNKNIFMNRLIMNCNDINKVVDHINHNTIDNRKINLRICTQSENTKNTKLNHDNTSGIIGVSYAKRDKVWVSYITVNYKHIRLGSYDKFEDAVRIRFQAEKKYFKEYAPQKDLYEQYKII